MRDVSTVCRDAWTAKRDLRSPPLLREALAAHPSVIFSPNQLRHLVACTSISGLVVEYIVAIDVTRVRFPADAFDRRAPAQVINEVS